jgi:hypothetical protein
VDRLVIEDLTADVDRSTPAVLRVRLGGRSASRDAASVLAPLFDRVLASGRDEARVIVLHFEKLEYFNSSTIAALVGFIRAAQDAKVGLTVVYDPAQRWQAMSFDALRRALRPSDASRGPAVHFTEV